MTCSGAENETRTRDPNLGKVMLYQLSYFRSFKRVVFVWDCKGRYFFFTSKLFCRNFQKKWLIFVFQPLFQSFLCLLERSFELLEESEIVFKVVSEVADLPLEHRDSLHSHTESESAVLTAVDS